MTKREPEGAGDVGPDSEERAASLLDRWRAHHDESDPAAPGSPTDAPAEAAEPVDERGVAAPTAATEASVTHLDEARARRDGHAEVTQPPTPPIPLRAPVADLSPDPVVDPAPPIPRPAPSEPTTDAATAAREVREALGPSTETQPDAGHRPAAPPSSPVRTPAPTRGAATSTPPPRASRDRTGPEVGRSLNVDFAPRLLARRVLALLLLVSFVAAVGAAYLAYDDPQPLTLGGAGTLLTLTLCLYAIRAGSSPTYLAIRAGQLEVRRGKTLEKFDLTSRFTRIEVVGKPGRRGWKVLLGRFGRDPLVITASLVDPVHFSSELDRYRPRD